MVTKLCLFHRGGKACYVLAKIQMVTKLILNNLISCKNSDGNKTTLECVNYNELLCSSKNSDGNKTKLVNILNGYIVVF